MDYQEALGYLSALRRYPPQPGTESTAALLAHLGDPHEELACVQVAGSNGKGSVARMTEATLRETDATVGLYTSPHLADLRERIRIDGRKIPRAAVVAFVEQIDSYVADRGADGEAPTFFETLTALALWEFDRRGVDVAVLEVGIGGTHDATSVVLPVASAVASVSLEHTELLGETVDEIARDQAGIAPEGPLVTGATGDALAAIQAETATTTVGSDGDVRVESADRTALENPVTVIGPDWRVETKLPLLGAHQARNAGVAATLVHQIEAAGALGETADVDLAGALTRGLRNAHWPGRFEVMRREPLVVLDGAHNPSAAATVAETLETFSYDRLEIVLGSLADKDHRGIAAALPPAARITACRPDHDRAEDETVLATAVDRETAGPSVETCRDVPDALAGALEAAGPDDAVLVTGSLHTVAEAREQWAGTQAPLAVRSAADATRRTTTGPGHGVHRVVRTRLRPRQLPEVREAITAAGGRCRTPDRPFDGRDSVPVELAATRAEFARACTSLADQPRGLGLAAVATELRETLGLSDPGESGPRTETAPRDGETPGTTPASTPSYPWTEGTAVMGILNVTPDSFHDGGEYDDRPDAVARAEEMVAAGADIVDVGGESTRPGADPVPVETEIDRVVPVVERIAELGAAVSIDTRKAPVARAALEAGADILNDVSGLEDPAMRLVAAEYDVPVVVMHSIDAPVVPGKSIPYDDVVRDVIDELTERVLLAEKAGLDRSQIIVDPGIGFGKTATESFELLDRLEELQALGCPVLVGHSHKSLFERVDRGPDERYEPTIAATALAADRGADIVRVHDVAANAAAIDVAAELTPTDHD